MTRILGGQISGSGCHTGDDVTHKTELNIDIRLYQLFVTCEAKISEIDESLTFDCAGVIDVTEDQTPLEADH